MSFLSGLRGLMGKKPDLGQQWIIPESKERLDELIKENRQPLLIYKHSYNCATCIFSKLNVEKLFGEYGNKTTFVFIDVIAQRPISNHVAEVTGVRHESPQVLLIKEGEVIQHVSHGAITDTRMIKILKE